MARRGNSWLDAVDAFNATYGAVTGIARQIETGNAYRKEYKDENGVALTGDALANAQLKGAADVALKYGDATQALALRSGLSALKGQDYQNQYLGETVKARIRATNIGADRAKAEYDQFVKLAPIEFRTRAAGARTAESNANVAQKTEEGRIAAVGLANDATRASTEGQRTQNAIGRVNLEVAQKTKDYRVNQSKYQSQVDEINAAAAQEKWDDQRIVGSIFSAAMQSSDDPNVAGQNFLNSLRTSGASQEAQTAAVKLLREKSMEEIAVETAANTQMIQKALTEGGPDKALEVYNTKIADGQTLSIQPIPGGAALVAFRDGKPVAEVARFSGANARDLAGAWLEKFVSEPGNMLAVTADVANYNRSVNAPSPIAKMSLEAALRFLNSEQFFAMPAEKQQQALRDLAKRLEPYFGAAGARGVTGLGGASGFTGRQIP